MDNGQKLKFKVLYHSGNLHILMLIFANPSFIDTRRSGVKHADRSDNGKLQMVDQSLLPANDCEKLCK